MLKAMAASKRLLIAGCGELGCGLARLLQGSAWEVWGLRRNVAALGPGVHPIAADLASPASLRRLGHFDAMIYTATPAGRDLAAYQQAYLKGLNHLLSALPTLPQRLIYVSSTSVLADSAGALVDEETAITELSPNAAVLHEAEQRIIGLGGIVLRLAGIYGPGRQWLLRQARTPDLVCDIDPPQWTNRIHAYDCVTALRHLLNLASPAALYHGVDDRPSTRYEVLSWLRQYMGLPQPLPSGSAGSGQASGKRISNQRLRASGWQPRYPDYRAGYAALLEALD